MEGRIAKNVRKEKERKIEKKKENREETSKRSIRNAKSAVVEIIR